MEELSRSWCDGLTPDPRLKVSEWADRHRVLSSRASAEPGRYRTDRTPYMRAIMDALSPSQNGVEDADYILTYLVHLSNGEKEPFSAVQSVRKYVGL